MIEEAIEKVEPILADNEIARLIKLSNEKTYREDLSIPKRKIEPFKAIGIVELASESNKEKIDTPSEQEAPKDELTETAPSTNSPKVDKAEDAVPKQVVNDQNGNASRTTEQDTINKTEEPNSVPDEKLTSVVEKTIESKIGVKEHLFTQNDIEFSYQKGLEITARERVSDKELYLEKVIAAFEETANNLLAGDSLNTNHLEEIIKSSIVTLASERAGIAITEFPDAFSKKIELLLDSIQKDSNRKMIHLNHEDRKLIEPILLKSPQMKDISLYSNKSFLRGDAQVEIGGITVSDILEERLADTNEHTPVPSSSTNEDSISGSYEPPLTLEDSNEPSTE